MMQKVSWEAPLWKLTFLIRSRNDIQVEHFLLTEISRWYQAKTIHTDFQMHCRCCINKYVEACVWWMAKLVAGTGLHVRLHTWRGGSSRVKKRHHTQINTSQGITCSLSRNMAQPQHKRGSFLPWLALGSGMLPSMTEQPPQTYPTWK